VTTSNLEQLFSSDTMRARRDYFQNVWNLEKFSIAEMILRSLKVTSNGTVRQITFLLVSKYPLFVPFSKSVDEMNLHERDDLEKSSSSNTTVEVIAYALPVVVINFNTKYVERRPK